MQGKELEIKETLQSPDEVRRSRVDAEIYLFYKSTDLNQFLCAVVKREINEGFLVTAYILVKLKKVIEYGPNESFL